MKFFLEFLLPLVVNNSIRPAVRRTATKSFSFRYAADHFGGVDRCTTTITR